MNIKAKNLSDGKAPAPESLDVITEPQSPRLIACQPPNMIVVETDESHTGGKLLAYLNGKRVMEADVIHSGQNVYRLDEYLPVREVYDLQIGFFKATS